MFNRLKREFREKRMVVESFALFLGVAGIIVAMEFAFFAWQSNYVAQGGALHYPETFLDAYIPFVPQLIWPYWAYYGFLGLSIWIPSNRQELTKHAVGLVLLHLLGYVAYIAYPSAVHRIVVDCDSLSCGMVGAMYLLDPGYGIFPSVHVAASVYMIMAAFALSYRLRWFVAAFALSIIAATVLVKQHYFVDLIAGIIFGLGTWRISWTTIDWVTQYFTRERLTAFNKLWGQFLTNIKFTNE